MPNRLAGEPSPYLQQHSENPVDWYPWSQEAFVRAKQEDRPVFLSIGYSACHWCHVMERESFTDPNIAQYLNDHFVSIKVDREERPDLDTIYMQAVTTLTGRGGWPLSVWLTPDGAPFYGGTYFPPAPRLGMASFRQVLETLAAAWKNRRDDIEEAAGSLVAHLNQQSAGPAAGTAPRPVPGRTAAQGAGSPWGRLLAEAVAGLHIDFDPEHGGWGEAPKFPQPLVLDFLLARQANEPQPQVQAEIELTLDAMAAGGIYDHLGGGFHRYSTDDSWLVPHFEKMLYDNAQLARCYLHAWQMTGKPRYRVVVEHTLDYLLREMHHPRGGFYSAQDADSEGIEGAFFVWTPEQIRAVLPEAELFMNTYGVTATGNFEGANILHLAAPASGSDTPDNPDAPPHSPNAGDDPLSSARAKLFTAREQRPRPLRDDKILAGWNGLALAALAEAARALGSEQYQEAAVAAGQFILDNLIRPSSRLAHGWKDGTARGNGFLEDYACVIEGLLALYQTTFTEKYYTAAKDLADAMIAHFRHPAGGFYDTSDDHETLVFRPRSLQDSPTPSGNALAATVLLKIAAYTGDDRYRSLAEETLAPAADLVTRAPIMFGQWLSAYHLAETGTTELAIAGNPATPQTAALLSIASSAFHPTLIIAARLDDTPSLVPLLQGREPSPEGAAIAWVCRDSTCLAPTSDPEELAALLAY